MEWFLYVSLVLATPLFAADTLHAIKTERADRIVSSRRPPVRFNDIRSKLTEIQAKRDARLGEANEFRSQTLEEWFSRFEVHCTHVPRRVPLEKAK